MDTIKITAADLRARLARARVHAYIIAARAGMHPVTLSNILRERRPLTYVLAQRIAAAIDAESQERSAQ